MMGLAKTLSEFMPLRKAGLLIAQVIIFAIALVSTAHAWEKDVVKQGHFERPEVPEITVKISGGFLVVNLYNKSAEPISVIGTGGIDSLQVSVADRDGALLSKNSISASGFWSPLFLISHADRLDNRPRYSLAEGDTLIVKAKLSNLLTGSDRYFRINFDSMEGLQVKLRLFVEGPTEERAIPVETCWITLSEKN